MEGEEAGGSTVSINLYNRKSVVDLSGEVHQLPCCIKYDGPSAVSDYFSPKTTETEAENGTRVEEAYFRGRNLQGLTIPLPDGYSGFVLGKKDEEKSSCWEMRARFDKLTYWNHDTIPSKDDTFLRTFHWFSVADALHNPVTADDLASVCSALKRS